MLAVIPSAVCLGIQGYLIQVEADIANGLPQWLIVGLPDTGIKEARERVRSAIKNSGFPFPDDKITINLAPADLKKEGSAFDLSMAVGILAAQGLVDEGRAKSFLLLGELALDGSLRPVRGTAVMASAFQSDFPIIVPYENAKEAGLVQNAKIYPARSLREVADFLNHSTDLQPYVFSREKIQPKVSRLNFSDVRGQHFAKRAIEIAVSGNHNLLFVGPPGAGKTMLAKRIPSILPPMDEEEALEVMKIHSGAGLFLQDVFLPTDRPFRSPHHTASSIALVGGGSWPRPGEISLAHGGVLFLDELPEFRRDALESLRSPMEDGRVTVSRIKHQVTYPCRFMLAAAMNPCMCGFLSDPKRTCRCSLAQIQKYQSRVSGPILDRIDLHVEVPALSYPSLTSTQLEETSESIRVRVLACREIQKKRLRGTGLSTNSQMGTKEIKKFASLDPGASKLLEQAMKELKLSARAYFKILKIARTIADLGQSQLMLPQHIAEAIQYRSLDRQWR